MSALRNSVLGLLLAAVTATATGVSPANAAEPETTDIGITNTCDPSGNGPNETKSRSEILARAQRWVDIGLTYNAGACQDDAYGRYRRDCSGLLSMAWGLELNLVSDISAGSSDNFMEYAANGKAMHFITRSELQPGDGLVRSGHVELFSHWADPANPNTSAAYVYSFNTAGETVRNPYTITEFGNRGYNSSADVDSYRYVRYMNVVDDAAAQSSGAVVFNGTLYEFARGADGTVKYWFASGGPWSSMQTIGGNISGTVSSTVFNGHLYVFARGTDGTVKYWFANGGPWSGMQTLGGGLA
jgi:hypothetical protein